MRLKLIAILAVLALAGIACSSKTDNGATPSNTPTSTSPSASAGATTSVTMTDTPAFVPDSITIKAGDTVEWKNAGDLPHTVTADDGSFDSGTATPITKGKTYQHTFAAAGTVKYHCAIHPNMKGTVIVQ